jgi:hypothetical protein
MLNDRYAEGVTTPPDVELVQADFYNYSPPNGKKFDLVLCNQASSARTHAAAPPPKRQAAARAHALSRRLRGVRVQGPAPVSTLPRAHPPPLGPCRR